MRMMEDENDLGKDIAVERNLGTQPLDAVMTKHGFTNTDLTATAEVQLTHKAVQRARIGRRLTPHLQRRIVETLNKTLKVRKLPERYVVGELFTY